MPNEVFFPYSKNIWPINNIHICWHAAFKGDFLFLSSPYFTASVVGNEQAGTASKAVLF